MMGMYISIFLVQYLLFSSTLVVFTRFGSAASQDACSGTKYCSNNLRLPIRFPFWVQDTQQPAADHSCCYPEFEISCSSSNDTLLLHPLPSSPSIKLQVINIDHKHQVIRAVSLQGGDCFPLQLLNRDLSASSFRFTYPSEVNYLQDFDLYNCSSPPESYNSYNQPRAPCLNRRGIYSTSSSSTDISYELGTSCTKIGTIAAVSSSIFDYADKSSIISLTWLKPKFRNCEAVKKSCSSRNYTQTPSQTICHVHKPDGVKEKLKLPGAILGCFFLLLAIIAFFYFYSSKLKQNQAIEKFLEDYRALRPARYSYADLKHITNQFKEKLGQGSYGTVYKGILSHEIFVAVKVLNNSKENGEDFINEVGTIGKIHHVNIVRLVGFCADGFIRALVYEFLPNDSLEKYIFSKNSKNQHFGWEKLQHIALGIAKGIEYLHQGCDQRILHFDIKPHNIMLDHNFNPKISDFGLAKLCSKEQSAVSMTAARGTMGYIAPEVLSRNFGKVSYKSDVYSYGMLLLEMVGGKRNNDVKVENISHIYFPKWIYNRLERGEELRIRIQEDSDEKIVKKLTIVGLWCIQWNPVDRPSMKVVIQMLEGDTDSLAIPPDPFSTRNVDRPERHLEQELAVISELE